MWSGWVGVGPTGNVGQSGLRAPVVGNVCVEGGAALFARHNQQTDVRKVRRRIGARFKRMFRILEARHPGLFIFCFFFLRF